MSQMDWNFTFFCHTSYCIQILMEPSNKNGFSELRLSREKKFGILELDKILILK